MELGNFTVITKEEFEEKFRLMGIGLKRIIAIEKRTLENKINQLEELINFLIETLKIKLKENFS